MSRSKRTNAASFAIAVTVLVLTLATALTTPIAWARYSSAATAGASARVAKFDVRFIYPTVGPNVYGGPSGNRLWDRGLAWHQRVHGTGDSGWQAVLVSNESEVTVDVTVWVGYLTPANSAFYGTSTTAGVKRVSDTSHYQNYSFTGVNAKTVPRMPYINFQPAVAANITSWLGQTPLDISYQSKIEPTVFGTVMGVGGCNMTADLANNCWTYRLAPGKACLVKIGLNAANSLNDARSIDKGIPDANASYMCKLFAEAVQVD